MVPLLPTGGQSVCAAIVSFCPFLSGHSEAEERGKEWHGNSTHPVLKGRERKRIQYKRGRGGVRGSRRMSVMPRRSSNPSKAKVSRGI